MTITDHLKRYVDPLNRRLRTMLMRGTLSAVDDTHDLQQMQVTRLEGETIDGCERVGQYGLASIPPAGSEVIVGQIGANADHQVILGVDDKSRPHPLSSGQTVLYDHAGTKITLDAAGNVTIAATGLLILNVGNTVVNGTLTSIEGNLHVTGNVVIDGTLNGHAP